MMGQHAKTKLALRCGFKETLTKRKLCLDSRQNKSEIAKATQCHILTHTHIYNHTHTHTHKYIVPHTHTYIFFYAGSTH